MDYSELIREYFSNTRRIIFKVREKRFSPDMHGEIRILHFIKEKGRAVLPSELSADSFTSSARIAMALRGLERKGLVIRETDKLDRRRVLVTITEKGEKMINERHDALKRVIGKILDELGEEDTKEYVRITGRIAEIIEGLSQSGEDFSCHD
jgi:Transcriptional regulators